MSILGTSRGSGLASYKHEVFEVTSANVMQKDFVLTFPVAPESELVMYNLSVLSPSEPGKPRDYDVVAYQSIALVPDFKLLPGDRIHIYYQIA